MSRSPTPTDPEHRRRPAFLLATLALVVATSVLAGCGNKGPLVHPEPAPASSTATP